MSDQTFKTASVAAGLATLDGLRGRQVRVTLATGTRATGMLTAITYRRVALGFGGREQTIMVPHAIELDGEDAYTHAFASVHAIDVV